MAKPFACHLRMDASAEKMGRMGVPKVVEADTGQAFRLNRRHPSIAIPPPLRAYGQTWARGSYFGSMPALTMASCQRLIWLATRPFISGPLM